MYNRYIPQPDGTHRRSQRQDNAPRPQTYQQPAAQRPTSAVKPPEPVCSQEQQPGNHGENSRQSTQQHRRHGPGPAPQHLRPEPCQECRSGSVSGFLKNLLPKDFDTGDLLIVLLLLLMAGDCPEEQNTALLTLVLYLFL